MSLKYEKVTAIMQKEIEEKIPWIAKFKCSPNEKGCFGVVAILNNNYIGYASVQPNNWIKPLENQVDAFIEVIYVDENHRGQGIAKMLINKLEEFAREYGYIQIRGWSSDDKKEALHMWIKLGYSMCPANMVGESIDPDFIGKKIPGYYFAKRLD